MKIQMRAQPRRGRAGPERSKGFVVVVLLVLVAVLVVLVSANAKALHHLKGRLSLVEKKQQERWLRGEAAARDEP